MSDLPTIPGTDIAQGLYRLKLPGVNEGYPGVVYQHGVSVHAVDGRVVERQFHCYGTSLTIEPWDESTLTLILNHLESTGRATRADELRARLRNQDPPKAKHAKKEKVEEAEAVAETVPATPKAKAKADSQCAIGIDDIEEMEKHELVELLKKLGGKVPKSVSEKALREKIAEKLGIGDD